MVLSELLVCVCAIVDVMIAAAVAVLCIVLVMILTVGIVCCKRCADPLDRLIVHFHCWNQLDVRPTVLCFILCRKKIVVSDLFILVTGRMPRSGKLPVLNLLTDQKIRVFAPQGRLVAPIHVKLSMADGHLGPLGYAKFHLSRRRGKGMRPQNIKNFHFLAESSRRGDPIDGFLIFTRLTILH